MTVQLSQLYVTTRKTITLTILLTWLYYYLFGRVMPLLFNTLSRFFILFLPRSNLPLISWLQSPSTVILELKKKSVTTSTFSPSICHEVMVLEDEMAGWHHWLHGRESEWTPGVGDGQGGLACCDSWGRKESDMTERLIWSDLIWMGLDATILVCLL